jgi:hypothetical protein
MIVGIIADRDIQKYWEEKKKPVYHKSHMHCPRTETRSLQ